MLGPQACSNQSGLGIEQCQGDLGSDEDSASYHPVTHFTSLSLFAHRLMERIVSASQGRVKSSQVGFQVPGMESDTGFHLPLHGWEGLCVLLRSLMGQQDDFLVTVPLAGPGWAAGGFFLKEIAPLPDMGGLDRRYL